MLTKSRLIAAIASALLLAGCSAQEPSATPTPVDYMGCILSDNYGIDDQTFGSSTFLGALQAQAQFGIKLRHEGVTPNASYSDYGKALAKLLENDCDLVVAIGSATEIAEDKASLYPKVNFVVVHARPYKIGDASELDPAALPNVKSLSYDIAQGGFLAGYLAATQSESGTVGAFGATLNRPEIAILAGFSQGVRFANFENGTRVRVLGQASQTADLWLSVGLANSNETAAKIRSMAASGADVIFPVVGGTMESGPGIAAATTALKTANQVSLIGSFTNWSAYEAANEVREPILGSVALSLQQDIVNAFSADLKGELVTGALGDYLGTLENGGVSLVTDSQRPINTNYEANVASLQKQIADGIIVVRSTLQ